MIQTISNNSNPQNENHFCYHKKTLKKLVECVCVTVIPNLYLHANVKGPSNTSTRIVSQNALNISMKKPRKKGKS